MRDAIDDLVKFRVIEHVKIVMRNFLNDFNRKLPTSMKMGDFKPISATKPKPKSRNLTPVKNLSASKNEIVVSKELGLNAENRISDNYYKTQ